MAGDPETGNIYAHATSGMLFVSTKSLVLWSHSLPGIWPCLRYGGRLASPIVDGNLVLSMLNGSWGEMAIGGNRCRFDKKTGDVDGGLHGRPCQRHSPPVVAVINGERLLISGGSAAHAFKIRTGEKVWASCFATRRQLRSGYDGHFVYRHGEENKFNGTEGSVVCLTPPM